MGCSSSKAEQVHESVDEPRDPEVDESDAGSLINLDAHSDETLDVHVDPKFLRLTSQVTRPTRVEQLELKLQVLLQLCHQANTILAAQKLEELETDIRACQDDCEGTESEEEVRSLVARFTSNDVLNTLRRCHKRVTSLLCFVKDMPRSGDRKWQEVTVHDSAIHPQFEVNMQLRFLEAHEKNPDGPATQILFVGSIRNFPCSLEEYAAVDKEIDLLNKEHIKNCEFFTASQGGSEKLHSVFQRTQIHVPLLRMRFDEIVVRDFAVCPSGLPLEGCSHPGYVVVDSSPPKELLGGTWEGWQMPAPVKGVYRTSCERMFCRYPSVALPGGVDMRFCISLGVPVPSWAVPLKMAKRVFANFVKDIAVETFELVKSFEAIGFRDRLERVEDFYGQIREIVSPTQSTVEVQAPTVG